MISVLTIRILTKSKRKNTCDGRSFKIGQINNFTKFRKKINKNLLHLSNYN